MSGDSGEDRLQSRGTEGTHLTSAYQDFGFVDEAPLHTAAYLLPAVLALAGPLSPGTRVLDVGCGNAYLSGQFLERGCNVVGIDLSQQGIQIARRTYPQ